MNVARHIDLVECEINAPDVARIQGKHELGIGEKNIRDRDRHRRFGDVLDLLQGRVVVTSLTLGKLAQQTAVKLECFFVVRLLLQLAVFEWLDRAVVAHPFGVVKERVVVPV